MRQTSHPPHHHGQFDQLEVLCTALHPETRVEKSYVSPAERPFTDGKSTNGIHKSPCLLKKSMRGEKPASAAIVEILKRRCCGITTRNQRILNRRDSIFDASDSVGPSG